MRECVAAFVIAGAISTAASAQAHTQRVVTAGTRIQAVGGVKTVPLPPGAQVVGAQNKYLIPGLWDMHVHPERYADLVLPLFVANGVTGIRDAGSEVPLVQLVQWKREIAAGARMGPRYLVSGPALNSAGDAGRTSLYIADRELLPGFAQQPSWLGHLSSDISWEPFLWITLDTAWIPSVVHFFALSGVWSYRWRAGCSSPPRSLSQGVHSGRRTARPRLWLSAA